MSVCRWTKVLGLCSAVGALATVAGCSNSPLVCDDTMKTNFKPDSNTKVVLVKAFKQGDSLALPDTPPMPQPPTALADLCLVKMVVGPGFQDGAGAPSTSAGIGIEVWLPAPSAWNNKIQNLGGGGWAGGNQASSTLIGNTGAAVTAASGYAVGSTDTGHSIGNGSFAMKQDGSINTTLWTDFAERSLHELAVKTKALVHDYYGKSAQRAYWNGCSTGGRQGYKIAQTHPDDYNGYLVGAPAFNWTKFITNELYPQIVMRTDSGVNLSNDKINFVSGAAVSACDTVDMAGSEHLGFILDPSECRYDPTRDATVLCRGMAGHRGVVGTSTDGRCVNLPDADAINKIWYGQTADGTYPDPAVDNAAGPTLTSSNQLWWGLTRGSSLLGLAGTNPFSIATDMVALELQDPRFATPTFMNAVSNGMNRWQQMTYAELASAYSLGIALQSSFANINTDNPDLSGARNSGAKIISYHGLADTLIAPQGSLNYFSRVSAAMGGDTEVNKFNRLFMIPGMGHCAGVGSVNGSAGPPLSINYVPLPATNQFFGALVDWVENNNAPGALVLNSANSSTSLPVCPYPQKAHYNGGSITAAASYTCN